MTAKYHSHEQQLLAVFSKRTKSFVFSEYRVQLAGVTKTNTPENEDLRPKIRSSFRSTKTKTL